MEKTSVNVMTCYHCNTKNEYLGYPFIGNSVQCVKVLCPRCISYTIVPKDCDTCRCKRCGLLMIVDLIECKENEESNNEAENSPSSS